MSEQPPGQARHSPSEAEYRIRAKPEGMHTVSVKITDSKMRFRQLRPGARLPEQAHDDDAGFDLTLAEDLTLTVESPIGIGLTGLAVAFPPGMYGLVVSRSGLAAEGTVVANAPGVIDHGYLGEIKVILQHHFHGAEDRRLLKAGWRVAQLLLVEFPVPWPVEAIWHREAWPPTIDPSWLHQKTKARGTTLEALGVARGVRGIGSTGRVDIQLETDPPLDEPGPGFW